MPIDFSEVGQHYLGGRSPELFISWQRDHRDRLRGTLIHPFVKFQPEWGSGAPEQQPNIIVPRFDSCTRRNCQLSEWQTYQVHGPPKSFDKEALIAWMESVAEYSKRLLHTSVGEAYIEQYSAVDKSNIYKAKLDMSKED